MEQRQFAGELVPAASAAPTAAQPFLLGARPQARLFAPAALRPRSYVAAVSSLQPLQADRAKADKRDQCLQTWIRESGLWQGTSQVQGAPRLPPAWRQHLREAMPRVAVEGEPPGLESASSNSTPEPLTDKGVRRLDLKYNFTEVSPAHWQLPPWQRPNKMPCAGASVYSGDLAPTNPGHLPPRYLPADTLLGRLYICQRLTFTVIATSKIKSLFWSSKPQADKTLVLAEQVP